MAYFFLNRGTQTLGLVAAFALLCAAACVPGPSATSGGTGASEDHDSDGNNSTNDSDSPGEDAGAPPDGGVMFDAGDHSGETVAECQGIQSVPAEARLLTRVEIDRALRDLLFIDRDYARALLPPENMALGFENNSQAHQASPVMTQAMETVAEQVTNEALGLHLSDIAPCAPAVIASASPDGIAQCGSQFITDFGRRVFRRPLSSSEHNVFYDLLQAGVNEEGLQSGISWAIQAMLQSPQFLYRYTQQFEGEYAGALMQIDAYTIASRLSFLLWGSTPDDALLDAAQSGELSSVEGIESQARRMLDDPKASDMVVDFHRQWLGIDRLALAEKDHAEALGISGEAYGESLQHSIYAFVEDAVLMQTDSVAGLFESNLVYVDDTMANVLGMPLTGELTPVEMPSEERMGLLTQPALMALLSHPDQSSPIQRGIFVRERILCEELPDPPADVIIEPPDPDPNATTRERFAAHTEDPSCQGCHMLIDPIGFGFEGYDEVGRYRTEENGLPIDISGELLYTHFSEEIEGEFHGAVELAEKLASTEQVSDCLTENWFTWAHGRAPTHEADECNLAKAQTDFILADHDIVELLISFATSDGFRYRDTEDYEAPEAFEEPVIETVIPEESDAGSQETDDTDVPSGDPACEGEAQSQSPIGFLDQIDASGVVRGWALDLNTPCYPLSVRVWMDGPPGVGQTFGMIERADQPRPDVNAAFDVPENHGFVFLLPDAARDGQPHTIYLEAYDTEGFGNTVLTNSPTSVHVVNAPVGFVDNMNNGNVNGWAYDPADPVSDVTIQVYDGAPSYLGGTFLGNGQTGVPRPDVNNAFGIEGNQGFSFSLPASALTPGEHTIFVEAMSLTNAQLRGFIFPNGFTYEVTQ